MRLILLVFFIILSPSFYGQKRVELIFENKSYQQLKKNPETHFKDSVQLYGYLKEFQLFAIKKGYLLASFDTIQRMDSATFKVNFNIGEEFQDAILTLNTQELLFIKKSTSLSEKVLARIPLNPEELSKTLSTLQNAYVNQGYPFASISLDSVTFEKTQLHATINVVKGKQYEWTEIHIRGDSSISKKYMSNLIGIKIGDYYAENDVKNISKRIRQINFIKELKPSELLFTQEGVELFLYLESVPTSSINGIVGLQPNPASERLSVTGEVSLKLINILNRGEFLTIDWRAIQPQTQSLKSNVSIPFLFKTPFGIDGKFDLYKRDSSFLELVSTAGVNYFLNGGSYIKAFYQNYSSNLLSGAQITSGTTNLASVTSNSYGLAFFKRQLDYLPNPSKGMVLNVESSAGSRQSRVTDSSIIEKSTVFKSILELEIYVPISTRHVLKFKNGTHLYTAPTIYENEMKRFGGFTSQRGFNEEELFATAQTTFSVEYRFLVDRNSHAFAFFDQSWYENNASKYLNDTPYGFGLGFSFGTNLGIFSISYALGKQFDNPILISNGKIHFGYVAYF